MNRVIKNTVIGFFAFGALTAWADGPGWTQESEVTDLVVTANGGINVKLSPLLQNCVSQSGYGASYASIYPEHPGIDRIQSNLLAAMMSGKKVALYLTNAQCKVTEIRIKK
ncbi:hypothetical protein [Aliikangiella coralliicola]|uniref:Uncharacterized protein n=1 Tax=Aliikangiella coralliicola TaxID=2592383 RepID=A0A545UFS5_9GAMM|nr:hypothetical protein [Aliikangiella coralliicola]TQV88295.1 hypothetical protein FLL46_07135 [Aliikangiella coralliicola]